MKTRVIFTVILCTAAGLFACRKETSLENSNGLPADFTAIINGVTWDAADSTPQATFSHGTVTITGTSADGHQLSITLDDTIVGQYTFNQQSASMAVYNEIDSTSKYAYYTNQGSSARIGGTADVTVINTTGHTISGIFSFTAYRPSDGSQLTFASGVFHDIPYTVSTTPSKLDTLQATIDSADWTGQNITAITANGQLTISGSANASQTLSLLLPDTAKPGTYSLAFNGFNNYTALYDPSSSQSLVATSGNLTVLQNDTAHTRIRGNFQFIATDVLGGGDSSKVNNGYFSVYYGQ